MAAGIFRRRQPGPNQPLRVNAGHPLASGLGLFGWGIGGNRLWDALTGKVIDLSAAANAAGTFVRGAGRIGPTLRMAGGERGGGAIYNPTSQAFTAGTLAACFKPAQAISGGSTRPYVLVGNSSLSRGLMIGMSGGTSSHAWGISSSNGWLFASGNGVDEQVWRTVGVNVTPGVSQSVEGWLDGAYQGAAGHTGVDIGSDVPARIWFGRDPSNYYSYPTGDVGWVGYWTRRLDKGEHRLLHEDPWSLVAPASLVQGWRFAAAAGGSDATAPGATLTATASLVAGAASSASTAAGATLTVTASIISGAASAASTAAGATLTASASLVAGSTTAASTASGATVSAAASLVAGAATAASTAPGATLTASASLVPGTASGAGNATAPGATLAATASLVAGAASAASTAPGATLTAPASLVAGISAAASTAPGATLTATASLIAGAGTASGTAAGATLVASASLIAGTASGAGNATASGATINASASLVAGAATASSTAPGATIVALATLLPGIASISGVIVADPRRTVRLRVPPAWPAVVLPPAPKVRIGRTPRA